MPRTAIANEYAKWINKPNQFYDGARSRNGTWQTAMARPAAAKRSPHTGRAVTWTYTGDWRMRQMALSLADDIELTYGGFDSFEYKR